LFKLAIILEGGVARRRASSAPDAGQRQEMVDRLIRYAGLFAGGERATTVTRPAGGYIR
jgi:hypothetical protein